MYTKFHKDDYHLPEDDNHHSHRRGNLKSYKFHKDWFSHSKIEGEYTDIQTALVIA
jgi:hypothetical protein